MSEPRDITPHRSDYDQLGSWIFWGALIMLIVAVAIYAIFGAPPRSVDSGSVIGVASFDGGSEFVADAADTGLLPEEGSTPDR